MDDPRKGIICREFLNFGPPKLDKPERSITGMPYLKFKLPESAMIARDAAQVEMVRYLRRSA